MGQKNDVNHLWCSLWCLFCVSSYSLCSCLVDLCCFCVEFQVSSFRLKRTAVFAALGLTTELVLSSRPKGRDQQLLCTINSSMPRLCFQFATLRHGQFFKHGDKDIPARAVTHSFLVMILPHTGGRDLEKAGHHRASDQVSARRTTGQQSRGTTMLNKLKVLARVAQCNALVHAVQPQSKEKDVVHLRLDFICLQSPFRQVQPPLLVKSTDHNQMQLTTKSDQAFSSVVGSHERAQPTPIRKFPFQSKHLSIWSPCTMVQLRAGADLSTWTAQPTEGLRVQSHYAASSSDASC